MYLKNPMTNKGTFAKHLIEKYNIKINKSILSNYKFEYIFYGILF